MTVTIQFFGHYSDYYPDPMVITVDEGTSVRDIVTHLTQTDARLARIATHCRFAIDAEYARLDDTIPQDSLLAVLPPMSGG